jgi:ribosomal protein S18 acetylase RimI-like enzyme
MVTSDDTLSIRPFEAADGPFCHALRREAFIDVFGRELDGAAVRAGAEAFEPEDFGRMIGSMDSSVAFKGADRVGFCTVRYPDQATAEILYVYVDPAHRGRGIGTRLVRHAECRIRDNHPEVTVIVLDTAVPRYNQAFYEHLGYVPYGHTVCRYPAGEVKAVRLIKHVAKQQDDKESPIP